MDRSAKTNSGTVDRVAIALSGLCLVHCLLLPFVVVLTPFLGSLSEDHLHLQMLFVVVPVSLFALALGFRRHRQRAIVAWGMIGLAFLFAGATIGHHYFGIVADQLLTVAGSVTLAITHYRNSLLSRRCAAISS